MNTNQMEHFLDIARTGNMTRSAERLLVAQPALSRSIAQLERELGVQLFERSGRGMCLTEEGRLLQARLEPLVESLHETEALFAQLREGSSCELSVQLGAGSLIASQALAEWMAANPRARVSLTQGQGSGSDESECTGPDVAVSALAPSGVERCQRFDERVMLAAPSSSGLGAGPVEFAQLEGQRFISMPAGTGFSRHVDALCREHSFTPNVALESDNPDVVRRMIGLGLGVGFWPEKSWGPLEGDGAQLLPLACGDARSIWVALTHRGVQKALAASLYQQLCASFCTTFSG